MTTWSLLLIVVAVVPIAVAPVADAIERARQRAGLSHKELALAQGLTTPQWSQQLHGYPGSHIWLDRLTATPAAFRVALLDELRAAWHLDAPTIADVHALLLALVRPQMARATSRQTQEDRCAG